MLAALPFEPHVFRCTSCETKSEARIPRDAKPILAKRFMIVTAGIGQPFYCEVVRLLSVGQDQAQRLVALLSGGA